jgi:hypothetical protein
MAVKAMSRLRNRITEIVRERASKLTITAVILLVLVGIPNLFGYAQFWWSAYKWASPHVWGLFGTTFGRFVLIGAGLIAIWLDQRRITRSLHKKQDHDLTSLRGRTLAFCDELKEFQKELGPEPPVVWTTGNSGAEFMKANEAGCKREAQMHHDFQLRFSNRAAELWHEHGKNMREDVALRSALADRVDSNERLNVIINGFANLANMTEN